MNPSLGSEKSNRPHRSIGLVVIAVFKLIKASLLILIGFGAFRLIHRDVEDAARQFINHFRGDPDNRYLHALLARVTRFSPGQLEAISAGAFIYAGLFMTEGVGLLLQKRWAEWLTIISGAGFIPLELHEVFVHSNWKRILVLTINMAIVVYLIRELRRKKNEG